MAPADQIINVVKRGSRGKEILNIEKIHDMVEYAVEDIKGVSVSYTHLRAHETRGNLVCRLLLEKKNPGGQG